MQRRHFLFKTLIGALGSISLFETLRNPMSAAKQQEEPSFKVEIRYRNPSNDQFDLADFYEKIPIWLQQEKFLGVREKFVMSGALLEFHKKPSRKYLSIFYSFRSKHDFSEFSAMCRPYVDRQAQKNLNFIEEVLYLS